MKSISAFEPKTLGKLSGYVFFLNKIRLDELSIKYLLLSLIKIATGFVSKTFIIIVLGYFF